MKKFNLTALLLCAAFCASCTAENAEAITTTAVTTTTAVSTEVQTTTAETTTVEITTATAEATTTTVETTAEPAEIELKEYVFDIDVKEFPPYEEYTGIEILSEEQQRAFWNAYYFYTIFDMETDAFFRFNHIDYNTKQNGILYATGYSYDSVINGFKTVLSEEIVDSILDESKCAGIDGEFYCGQGARGADIFFLDELQFVAVEMTEEKAVFKINALYGDFDNEENREYVEHNFEMVLIDGNWIVTKFEFWK